MLLINPFIIELRTKINFSRNFNFGQKKVVMELDELMATVRNIWWYKQPKSIVINHNILILILYKPCV